MTFILAQLWWLMPIVIAIVYCIAGFFICKKLIKMEQIDSPLEWWYWFILWLPIMATGLVWTIMAFLIQFPKKFAEKQINKQ